MRNLKYEQLTPIFRQHNIHLKFSTPQTNSNGYSAPSNTYLKFRLLIHIYYIFSKRLDAKIYI